MKSGTSQKYLTIMIDNLKKMQFGKLAFGSRYEIIWYVNTMLNRRMILLKRRDLLLKT
ncbi:hypothetical protein FORC6_1854 [Vibrio parahaemolyticus]|nr:hypothetical protein M636_12395 [Vibrio parahaemolyticus O1:K33 str. CDC_K4557]ALG52180.1 hypothetical protein FORC6_1854 [Vibrio parahaemolyticus]PIS70106.1 hypothetical protein H271_11255 [Vibrio parahaemolyticus 1911C]